MYVYLDVPYGYIYTSTTVVGCGGVNAPPLRVLKSANKELQLPNLLYLAGCTSRTRHSKTECHLIGVLRTPCKGARMLYCCDVATHDRQPLLHSSSGCQSFSSSLERTGSIPSPTYIRTYVHEMNIVDTLLT